MTRLLWWAWAPLLAATTFAVLAVVAVGAVEVRVPLDGRAVICEQTIIPVFSVPRFDDPPPEEWRRECNDRLTTWRWRVLLAGLGGAAIGLAVVGSGRRLSAKSSIETSATGGAA